MLKVHYLKTASDELLERVLSQGAASRSERLLVGLSRHGLSSVSDVDAGDLEGLHQLIAVLPEAMFDAREGELDVRVAERVFRHFQGESWSPAGEARALVRKLDLNHTSMSVGDMIECSVTGRRLVCEPIGFSEIAGASSVEV